MFLLFKSTLRLMEAVSPTWPDAHQTQPEFFISAGLRRRHIQALTGEFNWIILILSAHLKFSDSTKFSMLCVTWFPLILRRYYFFFLMRSWLLNCRAAVEYCCPCYGVREGTHLLGFWGVTDHSPRFKNVWTLVTRSPWWILEVAWWETFPNILKVI